MQSRILVNNLLSRLCCPYIPAYKIVYKDPYGGEIVNYFLTWRALKKFQNRAGADMEKNGCKFKEVCGIDIFLNFSEASYKKAKQFWGA